MLYYHKERIDLQSNTHTQNNFKTKFHNLTNTLPLFHIHPEEYADSHNFNDDERLVFYSIFDESISLEDVKAALIRLHNEVGDGTHHEVTNDMVPKHYTSKGIEPIDFMVQNNLFGCESNCTKYISRYKTKNLGKDLTKYWYYIWVNRYDNYENLIELM